VATLTIRGVDAAIQQRIRMQAAQHGRSMEAEVRATLSQVYGEVPFGVALLRALDQFRQETGGVDLELPARSQPRVVDLSGDGP